MFKKITFVLFAFLALNAKAQISIDDDTLCIRVCRSKLNDFIDIYAHTVIRSLGPAETIVWNRINNNLPSVEWSSAVCDIISCRGPEVSLDSFTFMSGGDTGILSFHFYCKDISGNGSMTVRFARANNPLEYVDVTIMAQAWNPTHVQSISNSDLNVFPNPAKDVISVSHRIYSEGNLSIMNTMGQVVLETEFHNGVNTDISALSPGVYTIQLRSSEGSASMKFVKQ